MSNASNINSLTALRERREALAAEQEAAKKGLTSTLAQAPAKAKDYALEDLALPALGVGLAIYVGYRLLRPRKSSGSIATEQVSIQSAPAVAPRPAAVPAARPVAAARPQPVPPPRRSYSEPVKKGLFDLGTLMTAGKLLIPAAQAIIGVVQNHQTNHQMKKTEAHVEAVTE